MKHHIVPHKDIQLLCINQNETERKGEQEKEREGGGFVSIYGPTEYCDAWVSLTEAGQAASVC